MRGRSRAICALLCLLVACLASAAHDSRYGLEDDEPDWRTLRHEPGYCAMYGACGHRADGDPLNCPNNTQAAAPSPELAERLQKTCPSLWSEKGGAAGNYCCTPDQVDKLATDTGKALPFIVGCPACQHNFIHLWCVMTCSPDQATFVNISEVQTAADTNATVVKTVEVWLDKAFSQQLYDSCKDVKFGAANLPAMNFIGGGAKTPQEWLDFLGEVKDKRVPPVGSPFQINFNPNDTVPVNITPAVEQLPSCGDALLTCSCADCPVAPGCSMPPPGPPPTPHTCRVGAITCWDFTLLLTWIAIMATGAAGVWAHAKRATERRRKRIDDQLEPLLEGATDTGGMRSFTPESPTGGDQEGGDESEPLPGDRHYPWLERHLQQLFKQHGELVARYPLHVIGAGVLLIGFCLLGLLRFQLETDPQRLWVGPTSQAARDKANYEASFGPFYRVTQLIVSTTPASKSPYVAPSGLPSVVTDANIQLLFDMQAEVDAISAPYTAADSSQAAAGLTDVCFKPFGTVCATQSLLQFWHMDKAFYLSEQAKGPYSTKLSPDFCFGHWFTQCRSAFQAPMDPHVIVGGFPMGEGFRNYTADSTSFVVTYPIDSAPANRAAAVAWEAAFVALAKGKLTDMAAAAGLQLAFSTERSVQDELTRESYTDASVVAVSYLVMLGYIALALAALPPSRQVLQLFVLSRAGLGLGGVLIVAFSVAGALGLCSMAGMWSTLIIMEVIPFLVLAVGVDNMFVMAHALGRQDPTLPLATRVGLALGAAGPSITLASCCEALAFGLGALTPMPAVRNFSLCACVAVLLDFVLQVTVFVALLVLDTKRMEQQRLDCAPCVRVPMLDTQGHWVYPDLSEDEGDEDLEGVYYPPQSQLLDSLGGHSSGAEDDYVPVAAAGPGGGGRGGGHPRFGEVHIPGERPSLQLLLQTYMERLHAPLLMKPLVQVLVLALFTTSLFVSLAVIPRLSVGLDQAVALPRDSYLQNYYRTVMDQLRVGPPLFLVVRGLNMDPAAADINTVCSISGCRKDSLLTRVTEAAMSPATSYIATPAASWLDDFLSWMNPSLPKCCRQHTDNTTAAFGGQCPPPDQPPCSANATECADCQQCLTEMPGGRPALDQVKHYLPWFLKALPSEGCAKGGAGAYNNALQPSASDPTGIAGLSGGTITASAFRTYHTALNKQQDFIQALSAARAFTSTASKELGLDIYPYSVFHIFFEQYLNVSRDALLLVGLPCLAVFGLSWAFVGSLWGAAVLLAMLVSLLLHLLGAMYWADIQVNAVSLVNLAMSLGIAVEFCAHILHSFIVSHGTRVARAKYSLIKMGASVTSGITLTKFAGVVVLAFAKTQIFEVYYFRLYLALVICGAAHGLVLLPVVLSRLGPPSFTDRRLTADSAHQVLETATSSSLGRPGPAAAAATVESPGTGRQQQQQQQQQQQRQRQQPGEHEVPAVHLPALAAQQIAAAAAALETRDSP